MAATTAPAATIVDNRTGDATSIDARAFGALKAFLRALGAAYTDEGEEWMEQELAYLEQNMAFASEFVEKNMPGAKLPKPEGTFLGWLDLRGLGLSDEELFRRIVLEAAVICVPGGWFGPGGEGHIRLNAGCPRAMLQEALERIRDVLYK